MESKHFISPQNSLILVIDVQEKLFRVMHEKEKLIDNLQRLIKGAQALEVPILITEQYPQGLGATIPEIASLLPDTSSIAKLSFSCCGEKQFLQVLNAQQCRNIIIAGIECHVCVYQTGIDLLNAGYAVHVVTDCVSSRTPENRLLGMQCMNSAGAKLTSTEMVLFELLRVAGGDKFKAVNRIVK